MTEPLSYWRVIPKVQNQIKHDANLAVKALDILWRTLNELATIGGIIYTAPLNWYGEPAIFSAEDIGLATKNLCDLFGYEHECFDDIAGHTIDILEDIILYRRSDNDYKHLMNLLPAEDDVTCSRVLAYLHQRKL